MTTRVLLGDCREQMRLLEPESVHAVITSPPYWSLRDYSTAVWEGGTDSECDHLRPGQPRDQRPNLTGSGIGAGGVYADQQDYAARVYRDVCGKCGAQRVEPTVWGGDPSHVHVWGDAVAQRRGIGGEREYGSYDGGVGRATAPMLSTSNLCTCGAWRGQLGLEPTPEMYVEHTVEWCRDVWRVLRKDGSLWLNLGDSYNNAGSSRNGEGLDGSRRGGSTGPAGALGYQSRDTRQTLRVFGIKHKDLVGIPWMVAFALRSDGWYLRSDVIWAKPNAMPESVTDRPSKSHEYVFLLTKSERYYYDWFAIRDRALMPEEAQWDNGLNGHGGGVSHKGQDSSTRKFAPAVDGVVYRNKRSVWTVATAPYSGAHFATFPPALIEPAILAGTSTHGVCPDCGAPYKRVLIRAKADRDIEADRAYYAERTGRTDGAVSGPSGLVDTVRMAGWAPSCNHSGEPDDWDVIESPLNVGHDQPKVLGTLLDAHIEPSGDVSFIVGRAGMARERKPGEGRWVTYRWQQRMMAQRLRESEHRDAMEADVGPTTFAHYIRTDRAGARPVPLDTWYRWIESGFIEEGGWTPQEPPQPRLEPVPAVVLDPFGGSGTTAMVANRHGRDAILIELNPADELLIEQRLTPTPREGQRAVPGEKPMPLWET